jgi:pimeloyl-ACP methyl ester carboxylesterase
METQMLEHDGGRLAFDDTGGPGELVVMVPGIGDLRQEYRFAVPRLKKAGYRVATMDLRGHGDASVDWPEYTVESVGRDISAVIEHLLGPPNRKGVGKSLSSAHVVGTSFAAAAAVWTAAERPEQVRSVVLVGPFVRNTPLGLVKSIGATLVMNGPWRVWAWDKFYASLYRTRKPEDLDEYRARLRANLAQPGRFEANKALGETTKEPATARLGAIQAATLVVMGSKDPDFDDPEAEARWIAERTSGTVAMIDGAGHYPHAEMPDKFAEVVVPFLSGS